MCSCGGDCCEQSDGLLSGLSGALMGALTDPMHEGEWFEWGGELDGTSVVGDLISTVEEKIWTAVENSGYAWPTGVWHEAGLINPFFKIEGSSAKEYGQAAHLLKAITDTVQSVGYRVNSGTVNFYATTYNAQTGQPTQTQSVGSQNQTTAGQCDWNSQSLANYTACKLGVTPTSAMTLGVIGALLVVVVLSRK